MIQLQRGFRAVDVLRINRWHYLPGSSGTSPTRCTGFLRSVRACMSLHDGFCSLRLFWGEAEIYPLRTSAIRNMLEAIG